MENFNITYNGKNFTSEVDLKKQLVVDSITQSFSEHPQYHKTNILTSSVYRILFSIFIEEKKLIFLDAPTGTGKSIIGYMIHYCYFWINNKLKDLNNDSSIITETTTYTLTSSKILQEQLENDFNNFNMLDHFTMLKGQANYECTKGTKENNTYTAYPDRSCKGMKKDQLENLDCFNTCGYIQKRMQASMAPSAVVNYAYFLTIMNAKFSPYFGPRKLVIADEGHLVPQIVTGMFNIDLTLFKLNKLSKIFSGINFNFGKKLNQELDPIKDKLKQCYQFFEKSEHDIIEIIAYIIFFKEICENVIDLMGIVEKQYDSIYPAFKEMWKKDFSDIEDRMIKIDYDKNIEYLESLAKRPEDIFIEGQSIGNQAYNVGDEYIHNKEYFKFVIRDLSEAEVTRKYFLNHTDVCIFMSATIGDIHEFGTLLGLDKSEYTGFNLPSTFDFSNSPIYITKSGYLNYDNFQTNIPKILDDCIKILTKEHPNYGGVIHTSTFQITNMLKEMLIRKDPKNLKRYLFYETSAEKDSQIELIRKSAGKYPYVIIGPSLYEGLDLKNDLGRLNIIVKAPYAGMDNYTRKKIKRFPFYYARETREKLMQAIGRTNRNPTDWSITYMLDTSLSKILWELPNYITDRIKSRTI